MAKQYGKVYNYRDIDIQDIQTVNEKQKESGINRIECHSKERCIANKMDNDEAKEDENIVRTRYAIGQNAEFN